MKALKIYYWRYFRLLLAWTLFLFAIYLYNVMEVTGQHQRKQNRLTRLGEALVESNTGHSKDKQSLNFRDVDRNKKEFNKEDTGSNEKVKIHSIPDDVSIDIENNDEDRVSVGIASPFWTDDVNRKSEVENSTIKTSRFVDNGKDITGNDEDIEDDDDVSNYTLSVMTSQCSAILSAIQGDIDNPLVLKARRLHWTIRQAGAYDKNLFSPPPNEMPTQRLPQAIIIGFGKCGTRALIDFLSMHPNIVATGPEIHFFDSDENFGKGLPWYKSQMPLSYSNQVTVEKTPSYIWSERALEEIYNLNKHMKLIVIIKDPVNRIVSQAIRSNQNVESLCMVWQDEELQVNNNSKTVQWSMYAVYLQAWMSKFPKSQIYVLESNEFILHPAKEIEKLERFLGIPHKITENNFYFNETKGFYCKIPFYPKEIICLSEGKGKPHPALDLAVEKKLYDYFRVHNEHLFRLVGRKFPWEPQSLVTSSVRNKPINFR